MRFGVLGPVEVWQDGQPVRVGSARERFVLATLLLDAGRVVRPERLVDAIWARPPRSATSQLHNMISNLRLRLSDGQPFITLVSGGYQLDLGRHEFDLAEFRRLAVSGREAAEGAQFGSAVSLFSDALSLWRGPAVDGVGDELLSDSRRALHSERLTVAESHVDGLLELGRHDDALQALGPLIAEHPYRERLHEKCMHALLAAGRRADALDHYRGLYRRLADELGVEPGEPLREWELRALRGEGPAGDLVPRQLPPRSAVLTGRGELLSELTKALRSDDPTPALLVGPGGVGKTALAVAAGHEVVADFPDGQLYANLDGSQRGDVDPYAVIGRFLRATGVPGTRVPSDTVERLALYRSHFADKRVLFVLDDAGAEAQLRPLVVGASGCRTIVTSRHNLAALVTSARWSVPVLADDDAVLLLAAIAGAARVTEERAAAVEISRLCGGLPLAVSVAGARLAARPRWTLADLCVRLNREHGRLDELSVGDLDVRASIALSYAALGQRLRTLFRRLALLSAPSWPSWVVEQLVGEPAADLLEQLIDVHLVEELGRDVAGQHRYRLHDLVAVFAAERAEAEEPTATRADALERVLLVWTALAATADDQIPHDWARAPDRVRASAPVAESSLAHGSPTAWFEAERQSLVAAVDTAAAIGRVEVMGLLALRMGGFLELRSYRDDRDRVLTAAIAEVRRAGDRELLVRLLAARFVACLRSDDYAPLDEIAEEQLALSRALGDPAEEALALTNAGRAANRQNDVHLAIEWLALAAAKASQDGVPVALLRNATVALAANIMYLGRAEDAVPRYRTALRLADEVSDAMGVALNCYHLAVCLTRAGQLTEAHDVLARALAIASRFGDDTLWAYCVQALADVDLRDGRLASAERRLELARQTHDGIGHGDGYAEALRSTADLAAARGEWRAALEHLRAAADVWRRIDSKIEVAATSARAGAACRAIGDVDQAAACDDETRALMGQLRLEQASLYVPAWYGGAS